MAPVFHEVSTTVELASPLFGFYSPYMKGGFSMRRNFPYIVLILLFSCLVPALGHTDCPKYTFVKIADTATPVPGGNGDTFEGLSSEPAVNGLRVAFYGEGGGAEGIFVGDGKTLNSVAAVGDPLPGGATIKSIVEDFAFSGGVFNIIINTPSTGNHGIYATDGSGLSKIVEFGESAPGGGRLLHHLFCQPSRGKPGISGQYLLWSGV
jgi:hypothetical protein